MTRRPARFAAGVALEHLDHMRAMGPILGAHVRDCIAMHGSMARLLGPRGLMVAMMGEEVIL